MSVVRSPAAMRQAPLRSPQPRVGEHFGALGQSRASWPGSTGESHGRFISSGIYSRSGLWALGRWRSLIACLEVDLSMSVRGHISGPLSHRWSPRWLRPAAWMVLFGAVLVGPQWLATAAVVSALCWIAARALMRIHDPSVRPE